MLFLFITIIAIILVYRQKYKYAFFLHIFIITHGFRFFMAPQLHAFGFAFQPSDLSIVFILFAYNEYFFRNHWQRLYKHFNPSPILKLFMLFIGLIFIEAIIAWFLNMELIEDILKTNRVWFTLAVLPLYHYLKAKDIQWIIKTIVVVTLIMMLIVPLQPILHFEIPGSLRGDGFGGVRYAIMPYFWFLAFWYIYFSPKLTIKQKVIVLFLMLIILFSGGSRKNLLAIIGSILLFYSLRLTVKNIITAVLALAVFGILVGTFANTARIKEFQTDVNSIIETNLTTYLQNRRDERFGNSAFRYYLFLERYEYLKKHPRKLIFGYGFIRERNVLQNPFSLMVGNKHTLDIGDISWAYLLIRYGMLGVILITIITLMNIKYFIKYIHDDPLFKVGFTYMITVIVLSFGDSFLSSPNDFLIPYMILILANPINTTASLIYNNDIKKIY